jgi:hypothetical protein
MSLRAAHLAVVCDVTWMNLATAEHFSASVDEITRDDLYTQIKAIYDSGIILTWLKKNTVTTIGGEL